MILGKSTSAIMFIMLSCHVHLHGQGYFSVSTDSFNRTFTGFEVIQEIPCKLQNSTNIFKEFKWVRTDICSLPNGWSALVCDCNTCWTAAEYTNPVNSGVVSACDMMFRYVFDFNADIGQHTTKLTLFNPIDSANSVTNVFFTINFGCFPNEVSSSSKFTSFIYPSPCTDFIHVHLTKNGAPIRLSIINLLGLLIEEHIIINEASIKLNTSNLRNGIYFMKLIDTHSGVSSVLKFEKK